MARPGVHRRPARPAGAGRKQRLNQPSSLIGQVRKITPAVPARPRRLGARRRAVPRWPGALPARARGWQPRARSARSPTPRLAAVWATDSSRGGTSVGSHRSDRRSQVQGTGLAAAVIPAFVRRGLCRGLGVTTLGSGVRPAGSSWRISSHIQLMEATLMAAADIPGEPRRSHGDDDGFSVTGRASPGGPARRTRRRGCSARWRRRGARQRWPLVLISS
jgi:hypothetical protein